MRSLNKISYIYLLIVLLLSPCYIVSMTGGSASFSGILMPFMDCGIMFWKVTLSIGLLLAFFQIITNTYKSIIFIMIILLCSVFVTYIKFYLNEYDAIHLDIVWLVLVVLVSKLEKEKALTIVYWFCAYLILINLFLSASQMLFRLEMIDSDILRPISGRFRSTGIFDTPLALGVFSLFTFFLILSFPKNVYKYRKTIAFLTFSSLLFSISKSSMLIFLMLIVSIFIIKILRTNKIYLSTFLMLAIGVSLFLPVAYIGYWYGTNSGAFSLIYKPYAILSFIEVLITNPQVLLYGFTSYTSGEYIRVLHSYGSFRGATSMESWLIHLIVQFGLAYVAVLFWLAYKAVKSNRDFLDKLYLSGAFIAVFMASFVSNGGIQSPTSFLFYTTVGVLIYSRYSVVVQKQ